MKGKNKKEWVIDNLEIRMQPGTDNADEQQPVICGYAAVYNSESDLLYGFFREVIRPNAFDSSMGNDIRALWNHNQQYVLGRTTAGTLNVRSDAKGLYFEVIPPETQWAKDLCESIRRKDINQMSFGFEVIEDSWQSLEDGSEMRELIEVNLIEVSVVTFPAYQATSAGMRSIDSEDETVQKRIEERKTMKNKSKVSEPEKRFTDYLKMLNALDFRAAKGPQPDPDDSDDESLDTDGDPDYDSDEDSNAKQSKRAKSDDDADGGEPEDPGSEADDSNNEDTTDDDEGDEDGSDEKRGMNAIDETADDGFGICDDCGYVSNPEQTTCQNCGSSAIF